MDQKFDLKTGWKLNPPVEFSDWKLPREFTQKVFDITPGLITVYNVTSGQYSYVNKAVESILGYQPDDILNAGFEFIAGMVHPDDLGQVMAENNAALEAANAQYPDYNDNLIKEFEYRMRHRNGNYIWVHTYGIIFSRDSGGKVEQVLNISVDITSRKQAEQGLIRAQEEIKELNESRFRSLADAIPQLVWISAPDGQATYYNKQWYAYTGKKDFAELKGSVWELIHPGDREATRKGWEGAVSLKKDIEIEQRLLRADGEYRWHLSRAVVQLDHENTVISWIGSATDIHEQKITADALKERESYFHKLSDNVPFMIWKTDELGRATYVNKSWVDYTGLSLQDSLGFEWANSVHPDDQEREKADFFKAFETRTHYHSKFRLRGTDGQYRWMLNQSNAIFNPEFEGYLGSLTDITEQELAQQATSMLMQKKDEFLSIASHELKTPITSMKASLQLAERLASTLTGNRQLQLFLSKANKQVNKLTQLVENLLDVTRLYAGKMEFNPTSFRVKELLDDCVHDTQYALSNHRILIENVPDSILSGDKNRLEQVIDNLLSNAIKYAPDAEKIIVSCSQEQDKFQLSVTDFGIGIPKDKLDHVFDRFFRVHESSQNFAGLGLGLYISSQIIIRHGGEMGVSSEEGKGSTFWFTIPVQQLQEPGA